MYIPKLPKCTRLDCGYNFLRVMPQAPKFYWQSYSDDHNEYMYIDEKASEQSYGRKKKTPNYNEYAYVIQRAYKKYIRKKYQEIVTSVLYVGPSKIVASYIT